MKYLFKHINKINKSVKKSRHIYLLLDYDGTLTPIVKKPELANLSYQTKTTLRKLTKKKKFSISIISGRSIKQLKEKIGIKNILLAGNHGLEAKGINVGATALPLKIREQLRSACKPIKGAFLEDKDITLSVHYRLVGKNDAARLAQRIKIVTGPYVRNKKIKVTKGKKVIEIRPPVAWDKGSFVEKLFRKNPGFLPVYIGDDKTDESAFNKVNRLKGFSVFVGKGFTKSNAKYYLKDTKEVLDFLSFLYSA